MPMMNELLSKLQESPPATEEDLRSVLAETGYDLVMTQPEDDAEAAVGDEAVTEGEAEEMEGEAEEEMGEEVGEEGAPPGLGEMLGGLIPKGPDMSPKGMSVLRMQVSKKALGKKGKEGRKR